MQENPRSSPRSTAHLQRGRSQGIRLRSARITGQPEGSKQTNCTRMFFSRGPSPGSAGTLALHRTRTALKEKGDRQRHMIGLNPKARLSRVAAGRNGPAHFAGRGRAYISQVCSGALSRRPSRLGSILPLPEWRSRETADSSGGATGTCNPFSASSQCYSIRTRGDRSRRKSTEAVRPSENTFAREGLLRHESRPGETNHSSSRAGFTRQ